MTHAPTGAPRRSPLACGLAALLLAGAAHAQFSLVPTPMPPAEIRASVAETERDYRRDAARHLYAAFPMHIYRGRLPPLMYAIAVVETDIDATGKVVDVRVVREPAAAKEVGPWVTALIRKVGHLPAPARLDKVTYTETWLVDKSGKFQVDTLSEGQRRE